MFINHLSASPHDVDTKGRVRTACGKHKRRGERKGRPVCNACVHSLLDEHNETVTALDQMTVRMNLIARAAHPNYSASGHTYHVDDATVERFEFTATEGS